MNVEDLISHTYSNPTHRCSWIKDDKGKISLICGIFFCRERLFINLLIYVFTVSNFPLKIEFEINISIYILHHQFSILTQIMIACCHKHKYYNKQLLTLNTSDMMCIINTYILKHHFFIFGFRIKLITFISNSKRLYAEVLVFVGKLWSRSRSCPGQFSLFS